MDIEKPVIAGLGVGFARPIKREGTLFGGAAGLFGGLGALLGTGGQQQHENGSQSHHGPAEDGKRAANLDRRPPCRTDQ